MPPRLVGFEEQSSGQGNGLLEEIMDQNVHCIEGDRYYVLPRWRFKNPSVAQVFIEVSSYQLQHCDEPERAFMLSLAGDTT